MPAPLVIRRHLQAPRDLVWAVWSDPAHLLRWWGPKGLQIGLGGFSFVEGGHFHFSMDLPDGTRWWASFRYQEISPPTRLRFTNSFTDDQRNIQPAPFPGDWPVQIAYTVTFEEVEGGTLLTLEGEAYEASPAEIAFFAAARPDMEAGFAGTFDQLEAHLADVT